MRWFRKHPIKLVQNKIKVESSDRLILGGFTNAFFRISVGYFVRELTKLKEEPRRCCCFFCFKKDPSTQIQKLISEAGIDNTALGNYALSTLDKRLPTRDASNYDFFFTKNSMPMKNQ